MESSKPWPWTRGAWRTTYHVLGLGLGLGGQVFGLRSKALDRDVCLFVLT